MSDEQSRTLQRFIAQWGTAVCALLAIAALAALWVPFNQSVRVVFGLWFTLFVPGYVWSRVFWKKQTIDPIERTAISLILSAAIISLTTFLLHRIGIRVSVLSAVSTVAAYLAAGLIAIGIQSFAVRHGKGSARTQQDTTDA